MIRRWLRNAIRPLRLLARRFVLLPDPEAGNFVGEDGCLQIAACFVAWNQVEGDYLEFGVYQGRSFAAAYHAIAYHRRQRASLDIDSPEYKRWKECRPRFFAFDSFEGIPAGDGDLDVDFFPGAYRC